MATIKYREKERIMSLRRKGYDYATIASMTGHPKFTIKTLVWRTLNRQTTSKCEFCGIKIHNTPHKKPRRFCSDRCRLAWWNHNRDQLGGKGIIAHTCLYCGKEFESRCKTSKYCSRECFKLHERKAEKMLNDYKKRAISYRSALSIVQKLLLEKTITKAECKRITRLLRKKYSIKSSSIVK